MRRPAVSAALVLLAAACAQGSHKSDVTTLASPANTRLSLTDNTGSTRTALVHIPAGLPANPSLVVVLHGGLGTGTQAENDYHWDKVGDSAKFVTAYPNGKSLAWNAGNCCGSPVTRGVDDVGLLDIMVKKLISDGVITASSKIYATGISNGGMLTYAWACHGKTHLAGIAPVSGSLVTTCGSPPASLRIVAIHGDHDSNIPEDGDQTKRTRNLSDSKTYSVNASVRPFLVSGGCTTSAKGPKGTPAYDLPWPTTSTVISTPKGIVTRSQWTPCKTSVVEKFVVKGGEHAWPCGPTPKDTSLFQVPSKALSATLTIAKEWGLVTGLGSTGQPVACSSI